MRPGWGSSVSTQVEKEAEQSVMSRELTPLSEPLAVSISRLNLK